MHQNNDRGDPEDLDGKDAVRQLSRLPAKCPISKCCELVLPSNLMMHMLTTHTKDQGVISSAIFENQPLQMSFNPFGYEQWRNYCIATLMYGGVKGHPETQPGLSYLTIPNSGLINDAHSYDNYLPVMMMVCRSTWFAQCRDKQLEKELIARNGAHSGIYVFWLVAPSTTRKLYFTLTVYDRSYQKSRSIVRLVRDYSSSQNPSQFLPYDGDYMLLRDSEVIELMGIDKTKPISGTSLQKSGISMELIVFENPTKAKLKQSCNSSKIQGALERFQHVYSQCKLPHPKGLVTRNATGKILLRKRPQTKVFGVRRIASPVASKMI